jgi:hypothetical protein
VIARQGVRVNLRLARTIRDESVSVRFGSDQALTLPALRGYLESPSPLYSAIVFGTEVPGDGELLPTPKGFYLRAQGRAAHPGLEAAIRSFYLEGVGSTADVSVDRTPSG